MKWTWESVGVALIASIATISVLMICWHDYACQNLVWALYSLFAVYLVMSGCALWKHQNNIKEQELLREKYQNEKQMRTQMESDLMKRTETLKVWQEEMTKLKEEINRKINIL